MPVWPSVCPQRLKIRTPEQRDDNRIVTPMEVGPRKTRRRFTHVPLILHPPPDLFILTTAQRDAVEALYVIGTEGGNLAFNWLDPIPDLGLVSVRFFSRPQYAPVVPGNADERRYQCDVTFEVV